MADGPGKGAPQDRGAGYPTGYPPDYPLWRAWAVGVVSAPVLACALIVATLPVWPDWPLLRTAARMLESLLPHLFVLGLAGTALMAALRAPRLACALSLAGLLTGAGLTLRSHVALSRPLVPEAPADLTLLWFNLLSENTTPARDLAAALIESPADVILLTEASPLVWAPEAAAALDAAFPLRAGCHGAPGDCRVMILARGPAAQGSARLIAIGRTQEPRLGVLSLPAQDGRAPLTLVAAHIMKPWFLGFADGEFWNSVQTLRELPGPLVMGADLNAAPWSARAQFLAGPCGLAPPRRPPATWPAGAPALGVPIDHVLVRGGVRLASLQTWGAGLGSNHLGLIAGLALPAPDAAADGQSPRQRWPACKPPDDRWQLAP